MMNFWDKVDLDQFEGTVGRLAADDTMDMLARTAPPTDLRDRVEVLLDRLTDAHLGAGRALVVAVFDGQDARSQAGPQHGWRIHCYDRA